MEREVQAAVVRRISVWFGFIQKLGPYLLLEIFLPGGTLIALLLFLYQRKQLADGAADMPIVATAFTTLRDAYQRVTTWVKASQPRFELTAVRSLSARSGARVRVR
jgi:hypothetical protein